MLKTERDKAICEKYGARDGTGHVHCMECPLKCYPSDRLAYGMCKATCHYDRHLREWVPDEMVEVDE